MPAVRQGELLPADRRPVRLQTADGLALVGELALPQDRAPVATLVCLHPLPTHGGSMDSHLVKKAAAWLPHQAGLAVLRFNTRGTSSREGTSDGSFGSAEDESHDVRAALDLITAEGLPAVWLMGWSFGSDLALRYGDVPAVRGAVLLSPTLRWSRPEHLESWAGSGKPLTAIVPEHDEFLSTQDAVSRFSIIPQADVVVLSGAKHLLFGRAERVFEEVVARVSS